MTLEKEGCFSLFILLVASLNRIASVLLDICPMEHKNTFLRKTCFNLNFLYTFHLKTGVHKYPTVCLSSKTRRNLNEQDRVKVSP